MRSASPLIVAGLALALASPAFAQGSTMAPSGGGVVPPTAPTTSQPARTTDTAPPAAAPDASTAPSAAPSQQTAPSAQGSSAPASATASGGAQSSAPASFTVGESVKDNTGASIGSITSLTGAGAAQMAVIKMGDQSFQVQTSKLGSENGAAEINMTKAQIQGMLKGGSAK